ncbi:HlyD family efflux transporter periplasmic adaptor subunit [Nocardioides ultimimeridianus]
MSRRRVRRHLLVPLAVLAVAAGGWAAYAEAAGTGHHYRLAAARVGDVSATVDLSGTVSAAGRADLVAGASGKVVAVPVHVGQQVRRGQVVVRLDQTALIAQVKAARASLAKARAQLASDEDAQTSSVTTASTTTTATSARTTARSTARSTAGTAPILATITKDQAAVTKAQTTASTALTTATEALQTEQSACATTSSSPTPSASDTSSDTPTASTSSTPQVSDDCQSALGAVQSAQAAVADAQDDLKTALDTLTTDLTTALTTTGSPSSPSSPSAPSSPSTRTPSTSSSGGTTVTAATLARDQASIDQARADLVSALAARRAAVVRAPLAGQLRSLPVARGDAVAAGDDVAVIVGKGLTTVEIEATQAQAAELRVGGTASVTPAGATTALVGRVSRIAHVPTASTSSSSATSSTTYAVQVTLTGKGAAQPPLGMPVAVSAVIGTARHVVTVPASAVSDGAVEVLRNGTATRTRVTTGVIGASAIEVLSGVSAGDQVVLADLEEDLPTSDSSTTRFGGSSGFGGSGSFGGGTIGGPPGMG